MALSRAGKTNVTGSIFIDPAAKEAIYMNAITMPPVSPVRGETAQAAGRTAAEFLLKHLAAWGVRRIYGVIGDANLYVLDALAEQNDLQYIACRHEEGAALMASAEAKLTGGVGVCLATSGPGIANLLNGLADAAMDAAGVLAITGQVALSEIGTPVKQYVDQQRLISAITDETRLVAHPDALPKLMHSALTAAYLYGKVAHLSIPRDLFTQRVAGSVVPYGEHLHQPLAAPPETVREAVRMLARAERPALLVGRGIKNCAAQVVRLAETLDAPVATTLPARPLFPNDHPLFTGVLGQAGSEAAGALLAESDLVAVLGADWWPDEFVPPRAPVLQIDQSAAQLGKSGPLKFGVVGDLRLILPQLLDGLARERGERSAWRKRVEQETRAWNARIVQEAKSEGTPVAPQRVIAAVAEAAAPDAVLAVDTGDHTLWFGRIFQAKPGQDILVSGRWRTLGFALPAAIAAKLACPERQVLAVAGDGGAVQTLMEFQTAVQYNCPVVLIIMNNGSYAMEKHRMEAGGLKPLGSELVNPDFAAIARACGGVGYTADSGEELSRCLKLALDQRKPAIIDVRTAGLKVPHTKI